MIRDRFILQKVPYERPAPHHYFSVNHRIAITSDGKGTAEKLAEKLTAAGFHFVQIVNEVSPATDVLIALEGLAEFDQDTAALECNRQLFRKAQIVATRFSEKGGVYINVQSTDERAVFCTGQAALAKTAAQEWPKAHCLTIELDTKGQSSETLAARIAEHILKDHTTPECMILADGQKTVPHLVAMETVPAQTVPLNDQSVLLVSGGGRGITAACLLALAKECSPSMVLLGRTVLGEETALTKHLIAEVDIRNALIKDHQEKQIPATPVAINKAVQHILAQREIHQTLQSLKTAGVKASYFATDILNITTLQQTIEKVRQQVGPITGILHGAGIIADKLIAQKTMQQFDDVFNTKMIGLKNLLEVTAHDPISVLLFFSSVAARFGNPGQCDYAMANDILNKVAEQQQLKRGSACFVKSFNWGPWETGMVTPELKALFKKRGVGLLSLERGTQLFVEELKNSAEKTVQVILGGRLDPSTQETTYSVNEKTDGFLKSHTVETVPVLPAALVLEWFYRALERSSAKLYQGICRNFKVLSGVRLNNFYTSHDEFKVVAGPSGEDKVVPLKLIGQNGTLHYTAEWVPLEGPSVFHSLPLTRPLSLWPWQVNEIYQPVPEKRLKHQLFHGEDLQAIVELHALCDQSGQGQLLTLSQKNWGNATFKTDVLMVDGVLQLLRLWSFTQLNYPTLPTKMNEFILYRALPPLIESLQCTFTSQVQGKYRTVSNAWLHDDQGQLYVFLSGIEMCAVQIN